MRKCAGPRKCDVYKQSEQHTHTGFKQQSRAEKVLGRLP